MYRQILYQSRRITGYGNGAEKTVCYGKSAAVKQNMKEVVVKGIFMILWGHYKVIMDKCKDDLETVGEEEVDGYQIQTTLYKIDKP